MAKSASHKLHAAALAAAIASAPIAAAQVNGVNVVNAKPTVNFINVKPQLIAAKAALAETFTYCGAGVPLITSANDSKHRPGSWHGKGLAYDVRSRGLTKQQKLCVLNELPKRLPKVDSGRWIVIFEPDSATVTQHFHLHHNDGSLD